MSTTRGMKTKGKEKAADNESEPESFTMNEVKQKLDLILRGNEEQGKKLDTVLNRISSLESTVKDVKAELNELKENSKFLEEGITHLKANEPLKATKESVAVLDLKIDDLENRMKRNNLIFWNIPEESEKDSCEQFISKFLIEHMKLPNADQIIIQRAHRSPSTRVKPSEENSNRPRPIFVLFPNYSDRNMVMKYAAKYLKDNPLYGRKIFISDDVSVKVRRERNKLKEKLPEIRKQDGVEFAYIPWLVPARIIYKDKSGMHSFLVVG